MKIAVFKDSQADEVNAYMEENVVLENGLIIKDQKIYILSRDTNDAGLTKRDQILLMGSELAKVQQNRLAHGTELMFYQAIALKKRGSAEAQVEAEQKVLQMERQVESDEMQIRQFRTMIEMLESDKIVV